MTQGKKLSPRVMKELMKAMDDSLKRWQLVERFGISGNVVSYYKRKFKKRNDPSQD